MAKTEIRQFFSLGYNSTGIRDVSGLIRLREEWNKRYPNGPTLAHTSVVFDEGDPKHGELICLANKISAAFPIEIQEPRFVTVYDPSDLCGMEIVCADPDGTVEMGMADFESCFNCSSDLDFRSTVSQFGNLRLRLKRRLPDFSAVVYDGIPVAILISLKAVNVLHPARKYFDICDVIDSGIGSKSKDYFQIKVKKKLPVHASTRLISERQIYRGELFDGVFWEPSNDSRSRQLHIARPDDPSEYPQLFLADVHLGPGKFIGDSRCPLILSGEYVSLVFDAGLCGFVFTPAHYC